MSEKHLVCQGAVCRCDFGTTTDKLMVKTQSKRYINDKDGKKKLMATHVDIGATFENNSFGSCKKLNNGPCAPVVTKWEGFYDQIIVQDNNGKALLEDSKATCAVSNASSIKIIFHGQTAEPTQQNVNNARPEVLAQLVPLKEDNKEYVYYTKDGTYLGGLENSTKVYLSSQEDYDKAKNQQKWGLLNQDNLLLKENGKEISNNEFSNNAYLVWHEASLTGNKTTAFWIAHTVNNALSSKYKRGKKNFNELFKTGYSSVAAADKLKVIGIKAKSDNEIYARAAVIDVLQKSPDPTGSAYFWDGLDLFTKKSELAHPKFKQYKSVSIKNADLKTALTFWGDKENKRKVNAGATINVVFETATPLKKVTDGTVQNDSTGFVGARTDSQNNSKVSEHLSSTGFHGGTMFWTTSK
ncbi:uncharacterized protein CHSO_2751 [Chryseobacterium sp. StRB126]|uniref:DUF4280 domain-containing protein n=1 Tax=Chryseobacterium sp. StRB126 TaxID=878220 RepID=UPI0004E985C3|nr:DUF4280 domain-containing protein [Chryseobacterium sp. StRB126]BAP31788.1 uncharacterized protein CHSO_2751 [Chryseobacterium sp. StRB126]